MNAKSWLASKRGYRSLAMILVIFAGLSLAYSLVLPLGEAADETDHFALVRFIAEHGRPPLTVEERASVGPKGDASPIYHGLVALLTQHVSVSDLPDLPHTQEQPERFIPSDGFRANLIFHTQDEAFPFHDIVLAWHLARLVSIPLGALTVVAAYVTALAIFPHGLRGREDKTPWFALAVAAFVAFLPRFVISSAVVNDDNLVVPLVALAIYCLVRVTQGDTRPRTFVFLGLLMGLAAITKYHSLVLLPEVSLVLLVVAWRRRWGWRTWLRRWGLSLLAFLLAASWWFIFLVVRFNQIKDLGWVRGLMATMGDPVVTLGLGRILDFRPGGGPVYEFGWPDWANLLFRTFWIVYGWLHVLATPLVYHILGLVSLVALLGLLKFGWAHFFSKERATKLSTSSRPGLAVLAFHFLVYLGVVAMRYLMRPGPETGQGRHLYPALTAIAIFFVLGLGEILRSVAWRAGARRDWHHEKHTRHLGPSLTFGMGGALLILSLLTPSLFILPVYRPYLPILTARPDDVPIQHRVEKSFAQGLDFAGYELHQPETKAGEALPISLYWHVGGRQDRDYLVRTCLHDSAGQVITCRQGHPVDGRYPMRAWEVGYLIRDDVYLPVPACAPPGDYQLTLSVLPLRLDTRGTAVDQAEHQEPPLLLGSVTLLAGREASPGTSELWIGDRHYSRGDLELRQIRQAVTAISYWPQDQSARRVHLTSVDPEVASHTWNPIASRVAYPCPNGLTATVDSFIVDPGVMPGLYVVGPENRPDARLQVRVLTHPREFNPPSSIPVRVNASFMGEVKLLGYEADLSPKWPGDSIRISATWQSERTMTRNHIVGLHLLDNLMNPWGQSDQILGSHYPNVLWAPGEIVSEVYLVPINPETPAGLYRIEFSLYDYALGTFHFLPASLPAQPDAAQHLYLGPVRIMDPAGTSAPSHPLVVNLGGQIQLRGYNLSSATLSRDEPLKLALHWQADKPPSADYTVFTQLIGPDGLVWGQQDNQPQGGRYPTSAWAMHDKVVDRYELKLREGAPPGEYRLLVGMYDLATGQRLAASDQNGGGLADNAIPLATLTLK
jgi:hypothetical protein